jgi:hypothetical protein
LPVGTTRLPNVPVLQWMVPEFSAGQILRGREIGWISDTRQVGENRRGPAVLADPQIRSQSNKSILQQPSWRDRHGCQPHLHCDAIPDTRSYRTHRFIAGTRSGRNAEGYGRSCSGIAGGPIRPGPNPCRNQPTIQALVAAANRFADGSPA